MDREILCVVTPDKAGKRLDAYLASEVEDLSRNYAENLIGEERVHVNDGIEAKKYKVREGDRIRIHMPAPRPIDVEPQNIPLDILYEDEDVIVVNKPRGMVVHPSAGNWDGTLVNAIMYHCADSLSGISDRLTSSPSRAAKAAAISVISTNTATTSSSVNDQDW